MSHSSVLPPASPDTVGPLEHTEAPVPALATRLAEAAAAHRVLFTGGEPIAPATGITSDAAVPAPALAPPRVSPAWRARPNPDPALVAQLAQTFEVPPILARILINRGYTTEEAARRFLFAKRTKQLDGPHTLRDMDRAAHRILQGLRAGETIFISGDYDVDGITSTAVMSKGLRSIAAALGARPTIVPYIPDRKAGFGLNSLAVGYAVAASADLIITVDNGTAGDNTRYAVSSARDAGMDVVVTDHHAPDLKGLPNAIAVVNPNRPDCASRFKDVSGAVVAWKVVLGVALEAGLTKDVYQPFMLALLDITALGLIADVMPLKDENRYITTLGLPLMAHSPHVGLQVLARMAVQGKPKDAPRDDSPLALVRTLLDTPLKADIRAWDCAMKIAPRMNAAGRLYQASFAFETIMTDNAVEAFTKATELTRMNVERQGLSEKMRAEGLAMLAERGVPDGGIALAHPEWNPGIVGIEASKIGEWCHRPTFMLGGGDATTFKGSGRNIGMVNLHKIVLDPRIAPLLVAGGGHEGAAGITVKRDVFPEFARVFNDVALEFGYPDAREPITWADATVTTDECTEDAVTALARLEPCGRANESPLFLLEGVTVYSLKPFNKKPDGSESLNISIGSHADARKLTVKWWDPKQKAGLVYVGARLDVLLNKLELNIWRDRRNVEGTVVDLRPSTRAATHPPA